MYIVGLTGGIGSGKSEAAKEFSRLGIPIVDTDVIAHALTTAGHPVLSEIIKCFGAEFLNTDATLNRAKLRSHILKNPTERLKLEALIHPAIFNRAQELLHENESKHPPYQILVVPLLFENNRYQSIVNKSLTIDCEERLQIQRAMERSGLSEEDVKGIMSAQISRENRIKLADLIISNNNSVTELAQKVREVHKKLIKTCIVSK